MPPSVHAPQSHLAGASYWATIKRLTVIAGGIDAALILVHAAVGAPFLVATDVFGIALYAVAHWCIVRRRNRTAVALMWLEVMSHAALGSLLIGWESGMHYFLLLFIPAIVVGTRGGLALPMVLALLVIYLGLEAACRATGPLSPLSPGALLTVHWVSVALVFGAFYAITAYYRATVLKAQRRLLRAATTDSLTGLANRNHFYAQAAIQLAQRRRDGKPVALLLADVDHFKRINDVHGHEAGDKVLVDLATLVRSKLREIDVLARWGGEEFLALLPATDSAAAAAVAERIRQAVADTPIHIGGRQVPVTLSIGIAEVGRETDLQPATARADQALYASKRAGRNRVSCAAPEAVPA